VKSASTFGGALCCVGDIRHGLYPDSANSTHLHSFDQLEIHTYGHALH
jgi:hypothetical protein